MRRHKLFRFVNVLILLALIFAPLTSASSRPADELQPEITLDYAPDRLLARLQDGYSPSKTETEALGVQSMQRLFVGQELPAELAQIVEISLFPGSDVHATQAMLAKDPHFVWVEPDYLAYPVGDLGVDVVPNDPLYPAQWGLEKISAPAAWDVQTGSEMVEIAIVDSGIDRTHTDLQPNLWVNQGEVPGNGLDDDNNQFIDDINGWDFVNEDNDPADDNGHGTQVAGVAAAATDNGVGIAGTCWNCKLMAVKVMSAGGVANYSDIALGVYYAADKGAEVINISLGGYSYSNTLLEAVQVALSEGSIVVAGAGNDDTDALFYPAAYDEVIAVAGTNQDDLKSAISNYGSWVDLSAPAVGIQTTFMGGSSYGPVDGTSMAAPFVSGLAGLLRSEHSDWSSALVRLQMIHTADSLDALNPSFEGLLGSGRLDAGSALTVDPQPIFSITEKLVNGDPLGRPTPGESSTLELTLSNDWLDAFGVTGKLSTTDAYVSVTQANAEFGSILAGGSSTGTPQYTFDVALAAGYDHPISFTLLLTANGGAYTTNLTFTIKTRSAEEQVGGTIDTDTTWTNDKVYVVNSNVGVAPGTTLTIQPGTDVLFNGEYSLNVGGQLVADGSEAAPIRFLSNTGSAWGRIYFDDPSTDANADPEGNYLGGNILRWVVVEGAGQGIGCNNATPYLSHLTTDGGEVSCKIGLSPAWLHDSELTGSTAFYADLLLATSDTPEHAYDVAYSDGYVYIADDESGLRVFDVENPTHPNEVSFYDTPGRAQGVALSGEYAYVADGGSGLRVIDISDPTNPSEIGFIESCGYAYDVAVSGEYVYIADFFHALWVFDVSDPSNPLEISFIDIPGSAVGVEVSSGYAYVASTSSGLRIIDVRNPSTLVEVGSIVTADEAWGIAISDQHAYVAGYTAGLRVIDVSNPTNPTEVGFYDTPGDAYGVTISDVYAYIADSYVGMRVIDVSDPAHPTSVNNYDTPGDAWAIAVSGKYAYVADGGHGLSIYRSYGATNVSVLNTILHNGELNLPQSSYVINNLIEGSIVSSGQVLSNTIIGGGISAGDGSVVQGNDIEESPSWGIQTSGAVTVQGNRLVGNALGIQASGGTVQGNLVANSTGVGLEINGDVSVSNNTFTGNAGNTIVINSGVPTIQGNNLEGNTGIYDIQNLTTNPIAADGNWWGTTDTSTIATCIYDYYDDFTLGKVLYSPAATSPIQTAPAYVRSVTLDPESPVGIETVTFEVEFSRPMDQAVIPMISFQSLLYGTWKIYNGDDIGIQDYNNLITNIFIDSNGVTWISTEKGVANFDETVWTVYNISNSGLPSDAVNVIANDADGSHWFGTNDGVAHLDGTNWTVYKTSNSGLPSNFVSAIAVDGIDAYWFGSYDGGVAYFDGTTWNVYNSSNSGLPSDGVGAIASDPNGSHWFGTGRGGVAKFDGTTWTVYNTSNSPLPNDTVYAINRDPDGTYWFGTGGGGVAKFDGTIWTVYNTFNSGLSNDWVFSISTDLDGSHWFGTESGVTHFDGISWKVYNSSNSELPYDFVSTLAINKNGLHWFGVEMFGHDVMFAIGVLNLTPLHTVTDNDIWLNDTHFQASFDITSLIELGDYRLTVEGATGTDGIQIAPNTNTTFTVDYAGAVSDTSAPPEPVVLACGADTPDTLSASWTAADPDSAITLYQYAIGTTPGGADIVNWIDTGETSFLRDNLSLLAGQTYYVSVKARNEGGLWSEAGISSGVVAGSGTCPSVGFSADVLNGEAPLTVQFSDQSSGDVTGWLWDFGDGNTSTLQHPEHVYGEAGVYSVALLISGPGGSDLETKVGYIVVYPGDITYSVTLPLVSK